MSLSAMAEAVLAQEVTSVASSASEISSVEGTTGEYSTWNVASYLHEMISNIRIWGWLHS